jgi:Ser/Thr protein kinase RdoA (MazF antagonist)
MTDFFAQEPAVQIQRLEAAGHAALRAWGIEDASLDLIKHRENAVFKMTAGDRPGALRIHRHGYHTDDELRSELQWMQALSEAGIQVPEIVPTESGEPFVSYVADGLPGAMQIDLFEWIDGQQLGSVEDGVADESEVERTFGTLGELAAKVHNQAVSWTLPERFQRHAWDADGLAGESPHWGRFWEIAAASETQRSLLVQARQRIYEELSALPKSPGNYSLIHADFAAENIMVDGDGLRLIDFDDAGFGWHQFELVTALVFITGEPYFDRAEAALIDGYRKHRQMTDEQLALLPLFYLARSTTYLGWVHTRSETETARELTPWLLDLCCGFAEDYLST